jgi:hypothetical protein
MPNTAGKPARAGKQATVGTPWTAEHRKLHGQQQQQIQKEQHHRQQKQQPATAEAPGKTEIQAKIKQFLLHRKLQRW